MREEETTYPPWQGRAILLVDLDAFFASVEQLDNPEWRGKPVIVGGDADKRGVVSTCSYEARAYGVHSAMPAAQATKLCPHAFWTSGHFDRYREVSRQVMAILRDETPCIQQVSIDEAFMDVTPTQYNDEHPVTIARRIQERVDALGVSCSIGLGTSKSVAKVASDQDKPHGITVVFPGGEAEFLSPLPTRVMSGIGSVAERELKAHGILTLGDVARADQGVLQRVFGKNANMMRSRCDGTDSSPVHSDDEVKSISNEMSFAEDIHTRHDLYAALDTACAKVCRRARRKGLKGYTVSLKLRFSDKSVRVAQRSMPQGLNDEYLIIPILHQLCDQLWAEGSGVRLAGMGLSHFEGKSVEQDTLFTIDDPQSPHEKQPIRLTDEKRRAQLIAATDSLRDKFGDSVLQFGRELKSKARLTGSSSKNVEDYEEE